MSGVRGVALPAGVPGEVRTRLLAALERVVRGAKVQEGFAAKQLPLHYLHREGFSSKLLVEKALYEGIWAENPWQNDKDQPAPDQPAPDQPAPDQPAAR